MSTEHGLLEIVFVGGNPTIGTSIQNRKLQLYNYAVTYVLYHSDVGGFVKCL